MLRSLLKHQAQAFPEETAQGDYGATRPTVFPAAFVSDRPPLPCLLQQPSVWVRGDNQQMVRAAGVATIYFATDPGVGTGDTLLVLAGGRYRQVRCDGPAVDAAGLGGAGGIFGAATMLRVDGSLVS